MIEYIKEEKKLTLYFSQRWFVSVVGDGTIGNDS